jgi:hypothetical protein
MDTPKVLRKEEALELVRRYKEVIAPRFDSEIIVMMFGSYSKGYANVFLDCRGINTKFKLLTVQRYGILAIIPNNYQITLVSLNVC